MAYRRHWIALVVVIAGSFAVLGGYGPRIRSAAPPVPGRVVGPGGEALFDGDAIRRGQAVWQAMGGQEVGSVWGHGAYVAPDWTADWLHREAMFVLDRWARAEGAGSWAALGPERQAALRERLELTMRPNTFDPATGTVRLGPERAGRGVERVLVHGRREPLPQRGLPLRAERGVAPRPLGAGPAVEHERRLAVEPVRGPVGRDVGAVPPDGADLLAAHRLPDALPAADRVAVEDHLAAGADDALGDGRRSGADARPVAAQDGERAGDHDGEGDPVGAVAQGRDLRR